MAKWSCFSSQIPLKMNGEGTPHGPQSPSSWRQRAACVADHILSISRAESSRQGLPSGPCRVGQVSERARGKPQRTDVPAHALDLFQLVAASGRRSSGG